MPKDWNSVSQSGSQSQDQRSHQQEKQGNTQQQQSKQQTSQGSSGQQPGHNKSAEDVKQRPKFLSDQELIGKIKAKQIEERRKIKIVNCKSEELVEMIRGHKLINYLREIKRQDKPTTYIACFKNEQDLIAFIEEKIANKYRFFLHPYIKTARDIQKQKEYQEKRRQREQQNKNKYSNRNRDYPEDRRGQNNRDRRGQDNRRGEDNRRQQDYRRGQDNRRKEDYRKQNNDNRRDYDNRRQNDNRKAPQEGQRRRGRNRPQYDIEQKQQKRYDQRKEKRYQPKNPPVQSKRQQKPSSQSSVNTPSTKPQQKQKPSSQTHQFNYTIQKNQIKILSNIYSKNRIVDDIVDRKMTTKWDRIKIYVQKDGLNKVLQLAQLIWDRINYGLKSLPDQTSKQQFIQVVLQSKCHVIHPNTQFSLLTGNPKKYFDKINQKNKYIIEKQFSIEDYTKGFKQSQRDICKKWKEWIIKAENDNIPNLLKLSWKLRREFYLNINIVVGKRGQVPFAVLEIQPESDKEKRPKPDTSVVNNYLN